MKSSDATYFRDFRAFCVRKKTDLVIVNVASALCQAKNKTFLLTTQLESVATDTPQQGCRSENSSNPVYYAQLPTPTAQKGQT